MSPLLPTMLVAGSLGAGKTTLVNRTIAACPGLRVAVIENEAGEISIDRELLAGAVRVVDVVGGCACCSLRGELHAALELIADRRGEIDAVVVEASGIADPVAIIQAFQAPWAREAFRLTALASLVDAAADEDELTLSRQLRYADVAVITKADVAGERDRKRVARHIAAYFPSATVTDAPEAPELLAGYLTRAAAKAMVDVPTEPSPDDGAPHGFAAVTVTADGPLERPALERWLSLLPLATGEVLRVKGTVALAGSRHRHVIQGAGGRTEVRQDPTGLGTPRRARIVVIGRRLDREELQAGLDACRAPLVVRA